MTNLQFTSVLRHLFNIEADDVIVGHNNTETNISAAVTASSVEDIAETTNDKRNKEMLGKCCVLISIRMIKQMETKL